MTSDKYFGTAEFKQSQEEQNDEVKRSQARPASHSGSAPFLDSYIG